LVFFVRAGFASLPIVVGETGWPTQGGTGASLVNACSYNNGLIARIASGAGTPKVKTPITVYIFEAFDELMKPTDTGGFQPYWGTLQEDGTEKYSLKWSGGGGSLAMCDSVIPVSVATPTLSSSPVLYSTPKPTPLPTTSPTKLQTTSPTPVPTTASQPIAVAGVNFGNYFAASPLPVATAIQLFADRGR